MRATAHVVLSACARQIYRGAILYSIHVRYSRMTTPHFLHDLLLGTFADYKVVNGDDGLRFLRALTGAKQDSRGTYRGYVDHDDELFKSTSRNVGPTICHYVFFQIRTNFRAAPTSTACAQRELVYLGHTHVRSLGLAVYEQLPMEHLSRARRGVLSTQESTQWQLRNK